MNRKRNLSKENAVLVAQRLRLRSVERRLFLRLVEIEHVQGREARTILQREIKEILALRPKYKSLTINDFNIVADWYCFAIVELTALKDFRSDAKWIARRLSITVSKVEIALERLKHVGLLTEVDGELKRTERDYIIENIPSAAIRRHHTETLELAKRALQEQSLSQREFLSISLPMDPELVVVAKSRIQAFSESLMSELQASQASSVYKLALQFFRLDKDGE